MSKFSDYVVNLASTDKSKGCKFEFPREITNTRNCTNYTATDGWDIEGLDQNDLMWMKSIEQPLVNGEHENRVTVKMKLKGKTTILVFNDRLNEFQGLRKIDKKKYLVSLFGIEIGDSFFLSLNYFLIDSKDNIFKESHDGTIHPIP
jgi:hypothetical protein